MAALQAFMFAEVYLGPAARREGAKIEAVIRTLFDHHVERPELLPGGGEEDVAQRVTDWIAGMTDRYAVRAYADLAVPREFVA